MKKVLIITYYWPPSGGPGVQRWLKFVKYLRDFNTEPIVYIPENPSYPIIDESLVAEIPLGITILKQPIKEPYKLAGLLSKKRSGNMSKGIIQQASRQTFIEKLLLFIRGNLFIPDARKNWVKTSVKFLRKYINANDIDTIITTGPPHSMHLIGLQLQQQLKLTWLADFRDPWTTIRYHSKLKLLRFARLKHKRLEKKVLQSADQIIVTSPTTKLEFESITKRPIAVITNGYDVNSVNEIQLDTKFSLSHIGTLFSERNPEVLWQVISDIVRDDKVFASQFQLNLVGAVSKEILISLDAYGLSQFINLVGYVSHEAAIRYQKQSQILLLIEIDAEYTKCIIPGKLFEYMVSNRPILAFGPRAADMAQIITSTNTGAYFEYTEYDSLKTKLLEYFNDYKLHKLKSRPIGLKQYNRKALTGQLALLIHK
jgi:hypothetical protein